VVDTDQPELAGGEHLYRVGERLPLQARSLALLLGVPL